MVLGFNTCTPTEHICNHWAKGPVRVNAGRGTFTVLSYVWYTVEWHEVPPFHTSLSYRSSMWFAGPLSVYVIKRYIHYNVHGALVVMKTHCTCDCKQVPTWCKQRVTSEETEIQGTAGMLQCCLHFGYLVSEAIWLRKVVCPIHRYLSTAQWGLMTLYIAVLINTQLRLPLRQAVGYVCVCVCVIDSTYYQRSAQRQQRVAS